MSTSNEPDGKSNGGTPAEASAADIVRRQDEFLANVSHELRTPMHGILSFSRFGMQKVYDAPREKLATYFEQINTSANRLMDLLNDLLDLSKNAGGKHLYRFSPQNIIDLLNGVVLEFNASIREKDLSIFLEHPSFSVTTECDGPKIRQVLSNLLTNAIKYSYPESRIVYTFEQQPEQNGAEPGQLLVRIIDEGIGVPHGELELIFEKFAQSSLSRTGAGGTGLGPAISREIIEAHLGRIWAEHNPDGAGSIFSFTLPYRQPHPEHQEEHGHA